MYMHAFLYVECYFDGLYGTREVLLQMVRDGSVLLCDRVDMWRPDVIRGAPGAGDQRGPTHGSRSAAEAGGEGRVGGRDRQLGSEQTWRWWDAVAALLDSVMVAVSESH